MPKISELPSRTFTGTEAIPCTSDGVTYQTVLQTSGTFTGTFYGFSTSVTGIVSYLRMGDIVVIDLPAISATSNVGTLTMGGVPDVIKRTSAATIYAPCNNLIDIGGTVTGYMSINDSDNWNFFKIPGAGDFSSSGVKGMAKTTITYKVT